MGLLLSRFRKQPKSCRQQLEELEQAISKLTQNKHLSQQYEKSFVGYLLILSFLIYIVLALLFYVYFRPKTWLEVTVHSLPLIFFPLVIYLIKKLLNMYFTHRKTQYDIQLRTLHEEKRRMLNEVMERETFNTARELLLRFDPQHPALRQMGAAREGEGRGRGRGRREQVPQQTPGRNGEEVRQRRPAQTPHPALSQRPPVTMATPHPPQHAASSVQTPAPAVVMGPPAQFIPPGMALGSAPGPPTPCPILPRDRSNMDKMVEYLVGDGPNNRYALICSMCHSHNGMALRDEFEYISFRCAYCYHLNNARKKKPSLPPQPLMASLSPATTEAEEQEETDNVDSGGGGGGGGGGGERRQDSGRSRSESTSSEDAS